MLNETNTLPEGLLDAEANELFTLLGAPTLIHLEGEIKKPVFVCTLLHGNETTGFYYFHFCCTKSNFHTRFQSAILVILWE